MAPFFIFRFYFAKEWLREYHQKIFEAEKAASPCRPIMLGSNYPVYNSDCIYINAARKLFEDMDQGLAANPGQDMRGLINPAKNDSKHDYRPSF